MHGGVGIFGDEVSSEALSGVGKPPNGAATFSSGAGRPCKRSWRRCARSKSAFNAGTGSALASDGTIENDASVRWRKDLTAGGVAVLSGFQNPVLVAEAVVGLACASGWRRRPPIRATAWLPGGRSRVDDHGGAALQVDRCSGPPAQGRRKLGTVGAVAADREGHVAAATSTRRVVRKCRGRVGDTPIIGAGTYADDEAGAASCTGKGEAILKVSLAKMSVDFLGPAARLRLPPKQPSPNSRVAPPARRA